MITALQKHLVQVKSLLCISNYMGLEKNGKVFVFLVDLKKKGCSTRHFCMKIAYFKVYIVYLGIYFMSFSWYIPFEGCGGPERTKNLGGATGFTVYYYLLRRDLQRMEGLLEWSQFDGLTSLWSLS